MTVAQAVRATREKSAISSELLVALTRLSRDLRRVVPVDDDVARITTDYGLAPRHVSALVVIAVLGPLSVGELASREGIALSTASLLVTQMADVGLVERREDPLDRRRTIVTLAEAHASRSKVMIEARMAPLNRALEKVSTEQARLVIDALSMISDELANSVSDTPAEGVSR